MALKFSIAIFLLRICVSRYQKVIIYTVLSVTEVYSASFFLLFVLQCQPTTYFWQRYNEKYTAGGKCIDVHVIANAFFAYSAISCWTDWTLGLLPIALVWNLQMTTRMKITVAAILAVGAM
jgi:hypothetical protein